MKRSIQLISLLLAILVFAGCSANSKPKLSSLSPEEQIEYLRDAGVEFPSGFPAEEHMDFILDIVRQAEEGVYHTPVVSNPAAIKAAEDVAAAVKEYYGH